MLKSIQLRDCMLSHPVKVRSSDKISLAMKAILDNKVSGVCVVDDEENLVGILSEMDCLKAILDSHYYNTEPGLVGEVMTRDNLVVANPNESIVDVAQDMLRDNHRRRPVVEDGKLVGQVTCRAVLKAVSEF